ncbi:MAG: (Fe-S)-binding protein [Halothiobacillus sp.]
MNTASGSPHSTVRRAQIRQYASDCVMCGICVPYCPTFALSHNEADGPRGRISLALGLAEGRLAATPDVVAHLDGCLTCRACESACPSQVQYGALIDEVRGALAQNAFSAATSRDESTQPTAAQHRWTLWRNHIFSQRQTFGRLWAVLSFFERMHLGGFIRRFGGRFGQTLPPQMPSRLPRRFRPNQAANLQLANAKKVGLFIGCTGESLNGDAVRASIQVLNALGYAVEIPKAQVCCGAMHQHGGDMERAAALRAENRAVFGGADLTAILVIGTVCAGELLREANSVPVIEITDFLAKIPNAEWSPLPPNPARVAIHLPCSQTRVLKQPASTERLLQKIPGLKIVPLATNDRCCGAAGLHVLMYPDQSDALRAPKLVEIEQLKPDFVVSANIGCATHIAAGLGAPVLHPVELVAMGL